MLMGRLKSLLEGSCEAWCKAAACKQEEPQAPQRVHGCFDRFRCLVLVGGHKALQHPWWRSADTMCFCQDELLCARVLIRHVRSLEIRHGDVQVRNFRFTLFERHHQKAKRKERKRKVKIYIKRKVTIHTLHSRGSMWKFTFRRKSRTKCVFWEISGTRNAAFFHKKLRLRSVNSKLWKVSERPCSGRLTRLLSPVTRSPSVSRWIVVLFGYFV